MTAHELAALAGERRLAPSEVNRLIEALNCLEANQVVDEDLVALCRAAAPLARPLIRAIVDVAEACAGDPEAAPGVALAVRHHLAAWAEWRRVAWADCMADDALVAKLVSRAGARVTADDVSTWSAEQRAVAVDWAAGVALGRAPARPAFLEVTRDG